MKFRLIGLLVATLLLATTPAVAAATAGPDRPMVLATEAEGEGDEEQAPPTTAVSEGGIEPAELAPPGEEEPAEDQWTAKFLAPTVAILGALGIVAAFVLYGLRLRGRYRIVE